MQGSPWRSAPQATAVLAWRDADADRVAGIVATALERWAMDWDLPAPAATPGRCLPASANPQQGSAWRPFARSEAGTAWIHGPAERECLVPVSWLPEVPATTPVVQAVEAERERDVQARIASALQLEPASAPCLLPDTVWSRWSGALVAQIPGGCSLLLEAGVVRRLLGPPVSRPARRALVPVDAAMAARPLRVEVELDGCELPLGELAGLQLGDVLRLRHPVDHPARVRHAGADFLFHAWLARSRGRRAVEFAAPGDERRQAEVQR
jgi:hypothetical protein